MITHKVVKGETVGTIAAKYLGSSTRYKEILTENPQITNPNLINVGQILRIPDAKGLVVAPITSSGTQLSVSPVESSVGYTDRIKALMASPKVLMLLLVGLGGAYFITKRK